MKNVALFLFVACATMFSACTKEGPKGDTGPAGPKGNANVVSSSVTAFASDWQYTAPSWRMNIAYPAITQDILDNGAVLVYMKNNQSSWSQLPLTIYQSATYSTSIEVVTGLGGLSIFWTDSDLLQPINPGGATFKIVVVAASGMALNPDVDLNDYQAVQRAFDLED